MGALVLTRKTNESVILTLPDGRRITVTVLGGSRTDGNLRLAFAAPSDVTVHREEVQEQIDAQEVRRIRHTKREG